MAWSTRQVAELAGTSLRAVRHYHEVGLLDEPVRSTNGYKQYGVAHLVRLVQIRRMTDLGFTLPQIAELGDDERPIDALRTLDAELGETIGRLQRARIELASILHDGRLHLDPGPDVVPPAVGAQLSAADRAFLVVLTRVVGPRTLSAYRYMLEAIREDPTCAEFDTLAHDADEATRRSLAERLQPHVLHVQKDHPATRDFHDAPRGAAFAVRMLGAAIEDLYNPAQVDVLQRLRADGTA